MAFTQANMGSTTPGNLTENTLGTEVYKAAQFGNMAQQQDEHDHTSGKGLAVGRLSSPVLSGGGGTPAGTLGITATGILRLGDGTTNQQFFGSAWTSWTPTMTQSGAVTITTTYAKYAIFGRLVVCQGDLTMTSAGTATNPIILASLPSAIAPALTPSSRVSIGSFRIYRSAATAAYYNGAVVFVSATTWKFQANNVADFVGVTPDYAVANTDTLSFTCAWEI